MTVSVVGGPGSDAEWEENWVSAGWGLTRRRPCGERGRQVVLGAESQSHLGSDLTDR